MSTRKEFADKLVTKGADADQIKTAFSMYREKNGPFDDEQDTYVPPVYTNDEIREKIGADDRKWYDNSTDPNGEYSKHSVNQFFMQHYNTGGDDITSLEFGRKIYRDDTLTFPQIQSKLQTDQASGELRGKLDKLSIYNNKILPSSVNDVREFLDSPTMENFKFWTEAPGKGYMKAASRLGAGIAEFVMPKKLEEITRVQKLRDFASTMDEYQSEVIMSALEDRDYNKFISLTTGQVVGDTFGNLMLMKQGIRIASKLIGGNMTLAAKGKTWKTLVKNTATRSAVVSGMTYLSTEGSLKDKMESATLMYFYMNTPILSSLAKTNAGAKVLDIGLNSLISSVYKKGEGFQKFGSYAGLKEQARKEAEELGDPEAYMPLLLSKIIPIAGPDAIFGLLSNSVRAQQRTSTRVNVSESARIFKSSSDLVFERFKNGMQEKYGNDWIKKMDDVERTMYENARVINANLERGELPPTLTEIEKTVKPRVNILEMAESGRVWRDSEGKLVDDSTKEQAPKPVEGEQGKPAPEAPKGGKIIVLNEEGEKLVDQTFKTIFSQSKKARSKAVDDAVSRIKDVKKLMKDIPENKRTKLLTAVQRVIEAKSDETREKRQAELNKIVSGVQEIVERTSVIDRVMQDPTKHTSKDANGKKTARTVAAEYAEAVQDIQDMINTDTSPKSTWRLQQQRDALESGKATTLPKKVLDKLQKTSVDKFTTEELVVIANEIDRLKQIGGTLYVQRQRQWNKEVSDVVSKIKQTSKQPKNVKPIVANEQDKRRFKGLRYLFRIGALRPWNLVDMLDGGKAKYSGAAHDLFINSANEKYSDFLRYNDARIVGGEGIIRANDMKVKELARTELKHEGEKLSLDAVLSIYGSSKNRLMHNAVLHGNFKGDADAYWKAVKLVEDNPKWKALADYIMYDYANNYNRVRKAFIRNENSILGAEENYIPMERIDVESPKTCEEIKDSMFSREESRRTLPGRDFTIDRTEITKQKPVQLGLYEQWERNVQLQERYINLFDQVSRMNRVLSDSDLKQQITDAYGKDYYEALDGYVESYGNPMSLYDVGRPARSSRIMRKNFAVGVLAYNLLTTAKQVPSFLLYMGQGGGKNLLTSLDDFNTSWALKDGKPYNKLIEFVEAKDPQIKHAHIERELAELKNTNRTAYEKVVGRIGENGMKPIIMMDKMVRTVGWYSVYLRSMEKGMGEQQAITEARNATLRTQPAASAKDLADIYKQGEGWNWMLMFSNQINQIYNLATYQLPKNVANVFRGDSKRENLGAATGVAMGLMANALVMHMLVHKDVPDTEEEIMQMLVEQSTGKTPIIGNVITSAMSGYDSANPVFGLLTDSVKSAQAALKSGDNKAYEKALKEILMNIGTGTGVPVNQFKRAGKFIDSGDPVELIGGKKD